MNNQEKSEVQLLKEFQELQQAYESLKVSVEANLREHKRTEDALRQSEEKYRLLIENSNDIIYTLTLEGVFMFVSSAWTSLIGHPVAEILGKPFHLFVHPDDLPRCWTFLQQVIATGKQQHGVEYRVLCTDGTWNWHTSSIAPIRDEAGRIIGVEGVAKEITERKEAEDLLKRTHQNYETFFHTIDDFLFVLDDKGNIIYTNNTVSKRLGYTPEELVGISVLMMHPPERREEAARTVGEMLDGITESCPIPLITKSGIQIPVETRIFHGIWNDNPAIFGISKDISKIKLSEEKFAKVFYLNPSTCGLSDLDTGEYIEVNDQFYSLLGFEKNEVIGKTAQELGILTAESAKSILQNANSDGKLINVEADLKAKNGDIKHVLMSAENIYVQDKKYRYTVVHDITERKQVEAELSFNKTNLELALEASQMGSWIFHIAKNKRIFDNQTCSLLGLDRTSFKGTSEEFFEAIHPDDRQLVRAALKKNLEQKALYIAEYRVVWSDGSIHYISARGKLLCDEKGNPQMITGINWDITDRKKAEQELIIAKERAEKSDRLKSTFIANMSHEIRTPMNGILGFAEILKEPDLTGEEQQQYINIIEKSGMRMLNIINDIIDISKIEAGLMKINLKESNIDEQIEYLCTFFKPEVEAKGMKLFFNKTVPESKTVIITDREKLYAIFTNLIKNTIKYSKEGTIEIGYSKKNETLDFYVKDTGIGIPKEKQEAIFERFIQVNSGDEITAQGAGLGLSITKAYVEILGGTIGVESEEGVGSTFFFSLPCNPEAENKAIGQQQPAPLDTNDHIQKLKLLVVEDDEVSRKLIDSVVKLFGKEILHAKTGVEAVDACRKNADIDLVLMDIRMPEMDGYEATREIRKFNERVAIIAQTAYGLSGEREKAMEAGCNDYIAKPLKKEYLVELMRKIFKHSY